MPSGAARGRSALQSRLVFYAACVVALCLVLALAAVYAAFMRGTIGELPRFLLSAAIYFAFAILLTRHVGLACLTGLTPVVGVIWSLALESRPDPLSTDLGFGLALASLASFAFVDEFLSRIASDADSRAAALSSMGASWRPVAGALLLVMGALAHEIDSHGFGTATASWLGEMLLPVLAAIALVPIGAMFTKLDEPSISRINRAREWRMHAAYPLTLAAVTRWSWSLSGIALVVSVLGCFGAERFVASMNWVAPVIALLSLLVSRWLVRDGRTATGLCASLLVTALVGLWAGAAHSAGTSLHIAAIYEALSIGFALSIVVASAASRGAGLVRAVEERTPLILCVAASVLLALLVAGQLDLPTAVIVTASAVSSLLLVTAFSSVLETVLPRRKSVAELYKRRG